MNHIKRCNRLRQICPRPMECGNGCVALHTATDSGHKVAHGRRTDYFGRAAEGNPGYPFEILDPTEPATEISFWQWLQDLFFTFCYIGGSVVLGALALVALVFATGLDRVLF